MTAPTAQLDLFSAAAAARDQALARVDDAADPEWKETAYEFLVRYLETHDELFPPDLWSAGLPRTRENRALGPLVLRAARAGLIRKTGGMRPSTSSHLSDRPVWRSTIYKAER